MTAFEFDRRAVLVMGAAFMASGAHRTNIAALRNIQTSVHVAGAFIDDTF